MTTILKRRGWALLACVVLLLLVATSSKSSKEADVEVFFRSLDRDHDGDIDADDIRNVIKEVGGENFDENAEIEKGVQNVLRLDQDNDNALLHKDLVAQWLSFAALMSSEMVGDWMRHAVGLNEVVVTKFTDSGWTGMDLPRLLNKNVDAILLQSNIQLTRNERLKLLGAIKLRMLNVGSVPPAPELRVLDSSKTARCGTVFLTWSSSRAFPEIHKYRLLRRVSRDDLPENDWVPLFEGLTTAFTDRTKENSTVRFDYRIEAWNVIGPSHAFDLHDVMPSRRGCDSASWFFDLLTLMGDMRTYTMHAATLLSIVWFFTRGNSHSTRNIVAREPSHRNTGQINTFQNGSSHHVQTDSGTMEDGASDSSSIRLPEMANFPSDSRSSLQKNYAVEMRREYTTDRCMECQKPIGRTTRHQCGMCLRVFCVDHTAIHPHLEAKVPFMGTMVLSTCGINSRCRCYGCAGMELQEDSTTSAPSRKSSAERKWDMVRGNLLLRKTLRIWKRKQQPEQLPTVAEEDSS